MTVDADGLVGLSGALLLAQTAAVLGLDRGLSVALTPWRKPRAVHDPGKVLLDLAIMLAAGGDCPADVAALRAQPGAFGPVASDPTVSRLVDTLAAAGQPALAAVRAARGKARAWAWKLAGAPVQRRFVVGQQPDGEPEAVVVLDFDATIVISHSDKELATRTWKRTYGHHPLGGWLDHGEGGTGEPVAWLLRPGLAGSNTAADHVVVFEQALGQLPAEWAQPNERGRRPVLVRTDGAGATHRFAQHLHDAGVEYSLGFTLGVEYHDPLLAVPAEAWTPAYNADGEQRDGAWVAELTGLVDLSGLARKRPADRPEGAPAPRRPATVHRRRRAPVHRLPHQHRRRAARRPGTTPPPPRPGRRPHPHRQGHRPAQPPLPRSRPVQGVAGAGRPRPRPTRPHPTPGPDRRARTAEPKTLRYQLFQTPGRLVRTARRTQLRLSRTWPWAHDLAAALTRLAALAAP